MNKVQRLAQENPRYWGITVEQSQYSEDEILSTLADIESINAEWQQMVSTIWTNVLTDEDGEMGGFEGYASDAHKELHRKMSEMAGQVYVSDKQNGQSGWPVRKWQNEVKRLRRDIKKLWKMAQNI